MIAWLGIGGLLDRKYNFIDTITVGYNRCVYHCIWNWFLVEETQCQVGSWYHRKFLVSDINSSIYIKYKQPNKSIKINGAPAHFLVYSIEKKIWKNSLWKMNIFLGHTFLENILFWIVFLVNRMGCSGNLIYVTNQKCCSDIIILPSMYW